MAAPAPATASDEHDVSRAMAEQNAFKRASMIRNGERLVVYSGSVGSGLRVFRTFIYRDTGSGLVLVHQGEFHATREKYPTVSVFPEFRDNGIALIAQGSHGSRQVEWVAFSRLREINRNNERAPAGEPPAAPQMGVEVR